MAEKFLKLLCLLFLVINSQKNKIMAYYSHYFVATYELALTSCRFA